MRRATFPESGEAIAEAERVVAWLRIPVIALVALGQSLEHPNRETTAFAVMLAAFAVWSVSILVWVYVRPAGPRLALAATGVDIVAISVLAVLSGGAFSNARLALFLVPVAAAFRFRPWVTAVATVVTVGAYVTQAVTHPSRGEPEAARFILTQAGFLAWIGVACVLLSLTLARRTEEVAQLGEARSRLLEDVQDAELRERRVLAEALHDHAIQNLLSARHELEEVADELPASTPLERADSAIAETVGQLRDAVFELHPYVLDQAGLEPAVRSVAQRAASRAGLELRLELRYPHRHPQDQLLFSAARELLANVVRHADARTVAVRLVEEGGSATLVVEDDGRGFPEGLPAERLADGHVGLASQRFRVEAAGGTMLVASGPDQGTRMEIRVPLSHVATGA